MHDMPRRGDRCAALRRAFLGWQCRVRQHAVRRGDGRPGSGMRPLAESSRGPLAEAFTTVLVRADSAEFTTRFRHIHRTILAPSERYEAVMRVLQSTYYQEPDAFSDALTALFGAQSATAEKLLAAPDCRLAFTQFGQSWTYPCAVHRLARGEPAYDATYWHNALFNARLDDDVQVLRFEPDWTEARSDPPIPG